MRRFSFLREQGEKYDGTLKRDIARAGQPKRLRPQVAYASILGIQFFILFLLIIPLGSGGLLLAAILVLISVLVRFRVALNPVYMLIDCGLFCLAALAEPSMAQFLFVFAYYFAWHNKPLYALLPAALSLIALDGLYYILPIQALLAGYILHLWNKESGALYEEADTLRQKLYRKEQTELQLLSDYRSAARMSQLVERQRLAEQLHDSLGHELTAAQLSVKSIGTLIGLGDSPRALKAQRKAEERLDAALRQLKMAVSRLEPDADTDIKVIADLFEGFMYPVELERHGDPGDLQAYHIQLLYSAVKEALTNIAKHAVPRRVKAVLESTDSIIKITIENDGVKNSPGEHKGNGLRYMRRRLEAVHGSLSCAEYGDSFRLIIILPKEAR
jgi:signal transduction histidine kinase